MMYMRTILSLLFICPAMLLAQGAEEDEGQEALEKVLEVLSTQEPKLPAPTELNGLLQKGAWEALSYLNEGEGDYTTEDLLEAVADYYNYQADDVIIKLINPEDYNQYGIEVTVKYRVQQGNIELLSPEGGVKDSWRILYLDVNYMALDMGDLRLFFTRTPVQE